MNGSKHFKSAEKIKLLCLVISFSILAVGFTGCGGKAQPATSSGEGNSSLSPESGDKTASAEVQSVDLKDYEQLYETYLSNVFLSSITAASWSSAEEIKPDRLINFYVFDRVVEKYTGKDWTALRIPAKEVEDFIQSYFDVSSEHLRKSQYYHKDTDSYSFDGVGGAASSKVINAQRERDELKLDFEYYSSADDVTVIRKGTLTIKLSNTGFKYVSCMTDAVSDHAVFKVTELAEKDFQSVQATVQARKKLPFDGHFNKKMAIIDGNLIIADDSTADNVRIYQLNSDTLVQEKTIDISHCAVGFSDKYILIVKASAVDYYNGNLELKKTVRIKADSSYRKNAPRFWGIVVIDENHIAWQANDRSVSAMEVANGYEKNIKKVEDNLSVLTENIYKTGRSNQIFVSGSAYEGSVNKDIKGASGSDDDIIVLGDITQGTVIDYIYEKELNHACISTKSGLVYKLPMEVMVRAPLAIDGFFSEFDKLYDLDNRKVYHFIDQSSINANNFIASYHDNTNFYFIMFSLEDGKEINYLIKV